MAKVVDTVKDIASLLRMPVVDIHLHHERAGENDPFYAQLVEEFYQSTCRRHPRFFFVKDFRYGVALQPLPPTPEGFVKKIESSAHRNIKKALRSGYHVAVMNYNEHLEEVGEIRRSADVRQGPMAADLIHEPVKPVANPPSRSTWHDYPFYGAFKENRLVAYAGCLVAGDVALIEHIFGHADHQQNGIMPLLIEKMVEDIMDRYKNVAYLGYGMWFGASETLRRFKKKMGFRPHKVNWYFNG